MTDEEITKKEPKPLEERLEQLKARVTELELLCAEKDKELGEAKKHISSLEQAIGEKEGEISALKQYAARSAEDQNHLNERLGQAVSSYRNLVTETNPEVPAELIAGDNIETVNDSLARARSLISKVRQGLEAETIKIRVPAGAPARTVPDFSTLSAREKIQFAIGGNK